MAADENGVPMDPRIVAVVDRLRAEMEDFTQGAVAGQQDMQTSAAVALEFMRRNGIPAVRASIEDCSIVFEIATPRGFG